MLANRTDCLLELRFGQEMIIFHHDSVVETHPMILPSAGFTAAFSRARRPGVVFLVSRIVDSRATHRLDELSRQVAIPEDAE